jgi:hypothetical protein
MRTRTAFAFVIMALVFAGCATSSEERAAASRVRVVKDADAVRGCQSIGSVTDDDMEDLQKKAARMGGDVALVTLQSQRGGGSGPAFRYGYSTYTTAEVYRCAGTSRR